MVRQIRAMIETVPDQIACMVALQKFLKSIRHVDIGAISEDIR